MTASSTVTGNLTLIFHFRVLQEIPTYYARLVKSRALRDIVPADKSSPTTHRSFHIMEQSIFFNHQHQMPFPTNEIPTSEPDSKAGLVASTSSLVTSLVSSSSSSLPPSSEVFTEHCGSLVQEIVQILNTLSGVRGRVNKSGGYSML